MRTFIAVELNQEIKQGLSIIEEQLKQTGADVKWVKPENIHLTLKFLGEVNEKKITKINDILKDLTQNRQTFYITIEELGAFPKLQFPRVIWVRIKQGADETTTLAAELQDRLVKIGFPKEKRGFSAHITIGRVRSNKNRSQLIEAVNKINEVNKIKLSQEIKDITLFKSTLTSHDPVYEALFKANLRNI